MPAIPSHVLHALELLDRIFWTSNLWGIPLRTAALYENPNAIMFVFMMP